MKHCKLFIWDFDGTLMDTYPFATGCLQKALRDFGHEAAQVEILERMMVNIPYAVRSYIEQYGQTGIKDRYQLYQSAEAQENIAIFPGVDRVLRRVRELGAVNAVFTNRGDSTYSMLEKAGIREEFAQIVTAKSPHFKVKPAPDAINWLMAHFSVMPEQTVMIGDRVCDLESGYHAGCRTCHLLTPAVPQYPACDWRVADFGEMLKLLE